MFWNTRDARRSRPVSPVADYRFRPALEELEDRWLPSTFTWFQNVDGDFNDASRWHDQNGHLGIPGANDDVFISGTGFTVTSTSDNTVRSLSANSRLVLSAGTFTVGDVINRSSLYQLVVDSGAGFHVAAGTTSLTNGTESLGSFNVAAGAKLVITGGTHHLDAGTSLAGAGEYHLSGTGATLSIDAAVNAPQNFYLEGGILTGTGTLTVSNATMTWTGGTMTGLGGNTVIAADGSLAIDGPNSKTLEAGYALTNNGMVTWQGAGTVFFDKGAAITNNGTWSAEGDLSLLARTNPFGTFTNTAGGVFTKAAGPGTLTMGDVFNNGGAVNITSGTLEILNSGGYSSGGFDVAGGATLKVMGGTSTYTFGDGTTITDSGTTRLDSGTLALAADVDVPNFTMTGGALTGPNTLTVDGAFAWTGGNMDGPGAAVSKGSLVIDGPNTKVLDAGYALTTNGTVTWQGAGSFFFDNGATITNNGTWSAEGDLSLLKRNVVAATFTNTASGVFTKAAGPGTLLLQNIFNNAGTANIASGTLKLHSGGYSSGAFNGVDGTTLLFSGGTYTFSGGSSLPSAGLVQVNGGVVVIDTAVSVQSFELDTGSVRLTLNGVLSVGGNYTQRFETTLSIDLGGTTPGAGYGRLNVAGTANLGGALIVDLTNDYSPNIGDSFQILTFGSRNGNFDFTSMPTLAPNGTMVVLLDDNDLTVIVNP